VVRSPISNHVAVAKVSGNAPYQIGDCAIFTFPIISYSVTQNDKVGARGADC